MYTYCGPITKYRIEIATEVKLCSAVESWRRFLYDLCQQYLASRLPRNIESEVKLCQDLKTKRRFLSWQKLILHRKSRYNI